MGIISVVCDGELVDRSRLGAEAEGLVAYLNKGFKGATIVSAYEAGFSGFCLHRYLCEAGIRNIVVNAASIEISARDRVKTDKRDSLKIATQLSTGRLKGIRIPSVEEELRRQLTRSLAIQVLHPQSILQEKSNIADTYQDREVPD